MSKDIQSRLHGTLRGSILQELFNNSAHFPIVNIFMELLLEGPSDYLLSPAFYIAVSAALIQAFFLGSWQHTGTPRPLRGNLIGPAVYSTSELVFEGLSAFQGNPIHYAYWGFAFAIGALQSLRLKTDGKVSMGLILLENVVRTNILLAGYWIFEAVTDKRYSVLSAFFSDKSHLFTAMVVLFTGLVIGMSRIAAENYLTLLRETADQLRRYSEWWLGKGLLDKAVTDPGSLDLKRRKRTVLFMDIRGFTAWSELQPPEQVVSMLNAFYSAAEGLSQAHGAVKTKMRADELMLVFPAEPDAVRAALELRGMATAVLQEHGLAVGAGIHAGPLVEGLIGSGEIKEYDVIGDTVNTAKRLCDAAAPGEVLVSEEVYHELRDITAVSGPRLVSVKGKSTPLSVYPVISIALP